MSELSRGYLGASTSISIVTKEMPEISFLSTQGRNVNLGAFPEESYVLFIYPKTGRPDQPVSAEWETIPGAKGCTAESCQFRDLNAEYEQLGVSVLGLSSQDTEYQREAVERLHLPYPLLADPGRLLAKHFDLPTFDFEGMTLYKRLTLVVRGGRVEEAFFPIHDPESHASWLLEHLRTTRAV